MGFLKMFANPPHQKKHESVGSLATVTLPLVCINDRIGGKFNGNVGRIRWVNVGLALTLHMTVSPGSGAKDAISLLCLSLL